MPFGRSPRSGDQRPQEYRKGLFDRQTEAESQTDVLNDVASRRGHGQPERLPLSCLEALCEMIRRNLGCLQGKGSDRICLSMQSAVSWQGMR